jgi:dihydrofolate reductase
VTEIALNRSLRRAGVPPEVSRPARIEDASRPSRKASEPKSRRRFCASPYVADGDHDRAGKDQLGHASALLLGRKTYEGLAAYWSPLKDDWANLITPKPKYVASRTLQGPLEWNATLLEGDTTEAVSRLKAELPSDPLIYGCGELARSLLAAAATRQPRSRHRPSSGWRRSIFPFVRSVDTRSLTRKTAAVTTARPT